MQTGLRFQAATLKEFVGTLLGYAGSAPRVNLKRRNGLPIIWCPPIWRDTIPTASG